MPAIEISYTDFPATESLNQIINDKIETLEKVYSRISHCKVVVSSPHRHHKNKIYHVQIQLSVPGADLVVNREAEKNQAHTDVYIAIRDAFKAARKQLVSYLQRKKDHHAGVEIKHVPVESEPDTAY